MFAFNNSKHNAICIYIYIYMYVYTNVIIYYIMNCRKSLREGRRNGMESRRAGLRGPKAECTRIGIWRARKTKQ